MAHEASQMCAMCSESASMFCAGCKHSPEYLPGDAVEIAYCNRECQKQHWPSHKSSCRTLQKRKKLLRAAKILRLSLLKYRELFFDLDLTKIDVSNGTLWLHQTIKTRPKLGPFPEHLTSNTEHRAAALAAIQCTSAMALLSSMTRKLLNGRTEPQPLADAKAERPVPADASSTLKIVNLSIGKPILPTKLRLAPDSSNIPHTVIKVGLRGANEDWIIDITGCQYVFSEVFVPFSKYVSERKCGATREPTAYTASETTNLDYFATLPLMRANPALLSAGRLERVARLQFASFVHTDVSEELLDGSEDVFEAKVSRFARHLEVHMMSWQIPNCRD